MAGKSTFKIEGMDELKAAFKRIGAATSRDKLGEVALKALEPVRSSARRTSAFVDRSGKLRDSIDSQVYDITAELVDAEVYASARHAHLVEYGHGGMKPASARPYLRPAFDSNKAAVESIAGTEIGRLIERAAI